VDCDQAFETNITLVAKDIEVTTELDVTIANHTAAKQALDRRHSVKQAPPSLSIILLKKGHARFAAKKWILHPGLHVA
jgi:hypothetical protein